MQVVKHIRKKEETKKNYLFYISSKYLRGKKGKKSKRKKAWAARFFQERKTTYRQTLQMLQLLLMITYMIIPAKLNALTLYYKCIIIILRNHTFTFTYTITFTLLS